MSIKNKISERSGIFFISFTCGQWLSLFEITNSYSNIYKWFDHLKAKGHKILAYVIMPNHIHILFEFIKAEKDINTIIGNGKRFLAYEIIKTLKKQNNLEILSKLSEATSNSDKRSNKNYKVFEKSFDCKQITGPYFFEQKLNYIHNNPCTGKWMLADCPKNYFHSSAKFYITGIHAAYPVEL